MRTGVVRVPTLPDLVEWVKGDTRAQADGEQNEQVEVASLPVALPIIDARSLTLADYTLGRALPRGSGQATGVVQGVNNG